MNSVRGFETDDAVFQRVECEVPALADEMAGLKTRALLANKNAARLDELSAPSLHAQPLGVGIAAVF